MGKAAEKLASLRWPFGFLGMMFLVGLAETSVAVHRDDYLDWVRLGWARVGQELREVGIKSDILGFGDSAMKLGFSPNVVQRITGKRTYNLALSAGKAPSSYFLLRRLLECGGRPAAVVVDFEPSLLGEAPQLEISGLVELLDLREILWLAQSTRDMRFLERVLVSRFLPSARYAARLRQEIRRAFDGQNDTEVYDVATIQRNLDQNQGAMITPHAPELAVNRNANVQRPPISPWNCHPVNWRYVRWFFELAEKHKIAVFWLLPPVAPALQADRERLGFDAQWTRAVESMSARFKNLTVIDGRSAAYPDALFYDATIHLDADGAIAVSTQVAAILKRSLSGDRPEPWIFLPRYRQGSVQDRLEDLNQSRFAVEVARTRKR